MSELSSYLQAALDLKDNFTDRQFDFQQERLTGERIIYAVDPSLLYYYFQIKRKRTDGPQPEICNIFGRESATDNEKRMGRVLANFVIESSSSSAENKFPTCIILPGHEVEFQNFYDNIIKKLSKPSNTIKQTERKILRELDKLQRTENYQSSLKIKSNIEKLIYNFNGPIDSFRKLNRLLKEGKISTLSLAVQMGNFNSLYPNVFNKEFLESTLDETLDFFSSDLMWWDPEFLPYVNSAFLEYDQIALTWLLKLNSKLREDNCRMILLTQNDALRKIARNIFPHKYENNDISHYNFSQLYIRHPKSLLAEDDLMLPGNEWKSTTYSKEWLNSFLALEYGKNAHINNETQTFKSLSDYASAAQAGNYLKLSQTNDNGNIESLLSDWDEHLTTILSVHGSFSKIAKEVLNERIFDLDHDEWNSKKAILNKFRAQSLQDMEETWNEFYLAAAEIGYDLIGLTQEKANQNIRYIPKLYVRDLDIGVKLSRLLKDPIKNKDAIQIILKDVGADETDHSGYIRTLFYGLLFALAGRWTVTKYLSERSVYIAKKLSSSTDSKVTGRESNYLACIAHRLLATCPEDLKVAREYLSSAEESTHISHELAPRPGFEDMTGLRFKTERIVLETTNILLCINDNDWDSDFIESQLFSIQQNMRTIEKIYDNQKLAGSLGFCSHDEIREGCKAILRSNFLTLIFLLECLDRLTPELNSKIREYFLEHLEFFNEESKRENFYDTLSIADAYIMNYVSSFFYTNSPVVSEMRMITANFLESISKNLDLLSMPYEEERLKKMTKLAFERQYLIDILP